MDLTSYCLAFTLVLGSAAICRGQIVTVDSLFVQAVSLHQTGMRDLANGCAQEAREKFNIATDKFRDYQRAYDPPTDSIQSIFEGLQRSEPQSPVYNFLLGRVLQDSRVDSLRTRVSAFYLHQAVAIDSLYPWPYVALANPYLARNDHASAIRCYDKAISIDSTFEFGYDALIAVYNEAKRTQEADRIAGLLVRKCPHSIPAILIQLAKARGEKDHERKIEMCRELIRTSPHSPATPYVYTELLIAVEWKGLDSLDVLARSVLQLPMPEFGKPRQFASIKLFSIAKTQGASTLNALAGELYQTKDPHVLRTIGKYYLDTLDNPDKALQFLAKAYDVCSKENAYNTLVAGLCTDKLLEESASNYQAVISYNSGMAYAKRGEYPRAIECLLGAAPRAEAANIVDVYFHLGSLYIKRDQNDEAVKWLTKGLALKSDANARKQLIGLVGSEVRAEEAIEQERNGNTQHPIDFRLCSLKGDTVQLSSYRKKVVVVSFWATWCLPCIKEMPHIQKLATEYGENPDVVFLCISRDHSRDSSRQFLTRNKYSMEMLFDDDAQPSLGVGSIPTLLLVDREGRVQFRHVGFDGNGAELVGMLRREITEVIARH